MAEFTLKVRRFKPEEAEGPYWETFDVDLDPTLSVLDGLLQAKDREDGSLAVRCSCRAAICGSCGMKINGQSTLACKTMLEEAQSFADPHAVGAQEGGGQSGGNGRTEIVVEPMGNMPVIKDLVTDMESTHWGKKHTPAPPPRPPPRAAPPRHPAGGARRARVRVPGGRNYLRSAVYGLHPVRPLRLVLPFDGGRPRLHRPGGAGQG